MVPDTLGPSSESCSPFTAAWEWRANLASSRNLGGQPTTRVVRSARCQNVQGMLRHITPEGWSRLGAEGGHCSQTSRRPQRLLTGCSKARATRRLGSTPDCQPPNIKHCSRRSAVPRQRANRRLSHGALANLRAQQRRPHRQEGHPCRDSGKRRSPGPSRIISESSTSFAERLLKKQPPRPACVAAASLILRPLAYRMGTSSTRRFWARPSGVSLDATKFVFPHPCGISRLCEMPCCPR